MGALPAAAYPFIEVRIDLSGLMPIAQRSPGVVAIVGKTPAGANGGTAATNRPYEVSTLDDAANLFAKVNAGVVAETDLYRSLKIAMLQDPASSKVYGVRVDADNYAAALAGLEAADDVTFVALANEVNVGAAAAGGAGATGLMALKDHVESMSSQGHKRLGVAMIDPGKQKSPNYVAEVVAALTGAQNLQSTVSRIVMIAGRGANVDVASAAAAAIAGYPPQVSMVLKKIAGVQIPVEKQYSPSEIKGLSDSNIIPLIDPAMIPGTGIYFAEGRTFTSDPTTLYIDIVRVLDDIDFRLKAGLVGMVGDARITKSGMTQVKLRTDEILAPLMVANVIANYSVQIPVLDVLNVPESAWSAADRALVTNSRANRIVDMYVSITYGPAVHRLKVSLSPKF